MSDKLICPFCNKPLQPTLRQSDEYWCENYDCPRTNIEWVGSQKLWQELIKLIEEKQHKNTTTAIFQDTRNNGIHETALEQKDGK